MGVLVLVLAQLADGRSRGATSSIRVSRKPHEKRCDKQAKRSTMAQAAVASSDSHNDVFVTRSRSHKKERAVARNADDWTRVRIRADSNSDSTRHDTATAGEETPTRSRDRAIDGTVKPTESAGTEEARLSAVCKQSLRPKPLKAKSFSRFFLCQS